MKKIVFFLIIAFIFGAVVGASFYLYKKLFEAVWCSDLPEWFKFLLLRG